MWCIFPCFSKAEQSTKKLRLGKFPVAVLLTLSVTTRWAAGAIATVSVVTMPLETWSSWPLNLPPPLKLQALSQSLADVLLPNWSNGRPAALDVHVISPLQPRTLSEAAQTQGHALQVGVQRKLASNLQYCRDAGLSCVPLVAETLGGLAEDFISPVQVIGRSICLRSGADRPRYGHN